MGARAWREREQWRREREKKEFERGRRRVGAKFTHERHAPAQAAPRAPWAFLQAYLSNQPCQAADSQR